MPGGRPRKYGPKVLEIMQEYINDWEKFGDVIPSIAGCAAECGVVRETFHQWSRDEDKPEFSYMLKQLLQAQERCCTKNGLNGEFNPMISKLVLAKHGLHDKVEQNTKLSGDSDNPIAVTEVKFKVVDTE